MCDMCVYQCVTKIKNDLEHTQKCVCVCGLLCVCVRDFMRVTLCVRIVNVCVCVCVSMSDQFKNELMQAKKSMRVCAISCA